MGWSALTVDTKTEEKIIYLTFDCGYENGQTARILDVLKEKNVSAAFFVTLDYLKEAPELTARDDRGRSYRGKPFRKASGFFSNIT